MDKNITLDNSLSEALSLPETGANITSNTSPLTYAQGIAYNYSYDLLTLRPYMLSYAYKQHGFLRTAIDQPIEDAFARDVSIESSTLSEEELEQLKQKMEDENDWDAIKEAFQWAYLFGGAGLVADTDQSPQNPLNEKALKDKRLDFIPTDRWETTMLDPQGGAEHSNFLFHGEVVLDKSRINLAMGMKAPYYVRMRLQGWGLSFFEQTLPPIIQFLKSQNVMLELLDEAKIDVLKINQLSQALIQPNGTELVKKRVDVASRNKNYKSMLVMDGQDDYQQKTLSFSGLPDMNREIRTMICAYLKMPESKIWGEGANGFSSGQDMLEIYNARIDSEIRPKMKKMIKWVVDLRCMQLFGRKVPDLMIKWSPLRVLTGLDEQNKKNQVFFNVFGMLDRGILKPSEAMEYLKREDIFTMDTDALQGKIDEDYMAHSEMIDDNQSQNNPDQEGKTEANR